LTLHNITVAENSKNATPLSNLRLKIGKLGGTGYKKGNKIPGAARASPGNKENI
jgi:hypothetical protein